MKVSERESSNEVVVYDIKDDNITLIDTPGLFGFKEQLNANTKEIERYKDLTRKYVSEAHIILYVMNSVNPIKASHDEELKWLFRDLHLLPRTVFVLSRFDEVADVEDKSDYNTNLEIKKKNTTSRLQEVLNLTDAEKKDLIIVAVSANPFGEGIEYWLSKPEEYKKLSHIDTLKNATTEVIERGGSLPAIIYETQKSVISDIIGKQLPIINEQNDKLNTEIQIIAGSKERYEEDLNNLNVSIREARQSLRDFFISYFSSLITQVNGTSLETYENFFVENIGNERTIINARINAAIEEITQSANFQIQQTYASVETEVSHYNSAVVQLVNGSASNVLKNIKVSNTMIKGVRDFFKLPIKFKPWQALKIAGNVTKFLPLIGVAIDIFSMWSEAKQKDEFEAAKKNSSKQFFRTTGRMVRAFRFT